MREIWCFHKAILYHYRNSQTRTFIYFICTKIHSLIKLFFRGSSQFSPASFLSSSSSPSHVRFRCEQENKMVPCRRWRTTRRCRTRKNHVTRLPWLFTARPRHELFLRRTYHGEFLRSMLPFLYETKL